MFNVLATFLREKLPMVEENFPILGNFPRKTGKITYIVEKLSKLEGFSLFPESLKKLP